MGLLNIVKKVVLGDIEARSIDKFDAILEEARLEEVINNGTGYYFGEKPNMIKAFTEKIMFLSSAEKVAFILDCIQKIYKWGKTQNPSSMADPKYQLNILRKNFLNHLLRTKLTLTEDDWITIG